MRLHKSHLGLVLVFWSCIGPVKAQYITQMGLGNYGAVHSFYLNPSLSAYSSWNWQINLAGVWANVNNNYLTLKMPYSLYKIPARVPANYLTESGNPTFNSNWITENLNGRKKYASISTDIYGPALAFRVKTWHFGLFSQASGNIRLNKFPENLAHAIFNGFDSSKGAYNLFNSTSDKIGPFNSSGNTRAAIGINISKAVKLDWKRQILLGASLKRVYGFQGYYMNTSGLSINQINSDSIVVAPTSLNLVNYGDQMGKGWGVDLGLTYVFHKKDFKRQGEYAQMHTRYFAKIGFALMDIGSIHYKDATFRSLNISNPTGIKLNGNYSGSSDYLGILDSFMSQYGTYTSSQGHYNVVLPGRMVLSGDLQMQKHLFVGTVINQSLIKRNSKNARYQSYMMLAPRVEYRLFEMSLPAILEYDYRSFRMGASFRFGPIYAGTNNLMTFVNTRSIKDADVFIGVAFGNLSELSFRKQARAKMNKRGNAKIGCFNF